jgi:hypothetical protein
MVVPILIPAAVGAAGAAIGGRSRIRRFRILMLLAVGCWSKVYGTRTATARTLGMIGLLGGRGAS